SYSRVQEVRSLAGVVGEDELSKNDKMSLEFGKLFEEKFLKQGKEEEREIGFSLDMAWEILSKLPKSELTRISLRDIQEHIKKYSD
ncbi:MAG: V-type ATP synthase subunit B, partial [Synergistaceae bacterium]|nr:V-type ATP synthase subunit B [Synergistaceae bacterium]